MTDIVERLRATAKKLSMDSYGQSAQICEQAAAEIERLRSVPAVTPTEEMVERGYARYCTEITLFRTTAGDALGKAAFKAALTAALSTLPAPPDRDARQKRVAEWCAAAFGVGQASSVEQRGLRLLEEAIEAYQAAGCNPEQAHKLVDFVFARPPGALAQELGGVGITTLALANACGASAEAEEVRELNRVLSKPLAHFAARNQAKNDAGFEAAAAPPSSKREG